MSLWKKIRVHNNGLHSPSFKCRGLIVQNFSMDVREVSQECKAQTRLDLADSSIGMWPITAYHRLRTTMLLRQFVK